jgi:hypothetical protein
MKKLFPALCLFIIAMLSLSCSTTTENVQTEENPASEGFNYEGSDPEAIVIADEVMKAMGGRQNWDATRHIAWNFFGSRDLVWDKWTGNVRIEVPRDTAVFLVNINTMEGRVSIRGTELTETDTLNYWLNRAKSIWINDSYWLVMPYKLKDSGLTLNYLGKDTTQTGENADVLALSFEAVGVTPQNRYKVWVDESSRLVSQWAYYANPTDTVPGFILPWLDWQNYGSIKLSGDRGQRKLSNIRVYDELPESVYMLFDKVNLD